MAAAAPINEIDSDQAYKNRHSGYNPIISSTQKTFDDENFKNLEKKN